MSTQEAIILMMAQKLKTCDEQEMRDLCAQSPDAGPCADETYSTLDRWSKLEPVVQQKILSLIRDNDIHSEMHKLRMQIHLLMKSQTDRLLSVKEKGQ